VKINILGISSHDNERGCYQNMSISIKSLNQREGKYFDRIVYRLRLMKWIWTPEFLSNQPTFHFSNFSSSYKKCTEKAFKVTPINQTLQLSDSSERKNLSKKLKISQSFFSLS